MEDNQRLVDTVEPVAQPTGNDMRNWRNRFDERQLKEIDFSILYKEQFHHGTEGHNAKMIIATMASLLDFFTTGTGYEIMTGTGDHPAIPMAPK